MNAKQILVEKIEVFKKQFTYKYVGGGYFRDTTVPNGMKADIIHGDEIINRFCDDLVKHLTDDQAV